MLAGILGAKNVTVRRTEKNPGGPGRIDGQGVNISSGRTDGFPSLAPSTHRGNGNQKTSNRDAHHAGAETPYRHRFTLYKGLALSPLTGFSQLGGRLRSAEFLAKGSGPEKEGAANETSQAMTIADCS